MSYTRQVNLEATNDIDFYKHSETIKLQYRCRSPDTHVNFKFRVHEQSCRVHADAHQAANDLYNGTHEGGAVFVGRLHCATCNVRNYTAHATEL